MVIHYFFCTFCTDTYEGIGKWGQAWKWTAKWRMLQERTGGWWQSFIYDKLQMVFWL
jgi:hypothetical protein